MTIRNKLFQSWKNFLFFFLYSDKSILSEYYWTYLYAIIISLFVFETKYTIPCLLMIIILIVYSYYKDFKNES